MQKRQLMSKALLAAILTLLVVPASALAGTSGDFSARVYAQNMPMYALTIDNTHVNYVDPGNPYVSIPRGSEAIGDKDVTISNTGALPVQVCVVATSEPTGTADSGETTLTVPLASDWSDYINTSNEQTDSNGSGKLLWMWTTSGLTYPWERIPVDAIGARELLNPLAKGDSAIFHTTIMAPAHWPYNTSVDYSWGGTILAYTVDPV